MVPLGYRMHALLPFNLIYDNISERDSEEDFPQHLEQSNLITATPRPSLPAMNRGPGTNAAAWRSLVSQEARC